MKKNIDQQIENIIDEVMKKSALQSPSSDFTRSVMSGIENVSLSTLTTYKPLISKKAWVIVGLFIILFYAYLFMYTSTSLTGFIDFGFLYNNNVVKAISAIEISSSTLYAVIFTSLMLLIQIPVLKYYFEKRLSVK